LLLSGDWFGLGFSCASVSDDSPEFFDLDFGVDTANVSAYAAGWGCYARPFQLSQEAWRNSKPSCCFS